ncbi:MAG: hypothetical protein ACOX6T_11405 [Myxococcales bacterium]|jgi:hypothetical protein
MKLRAYVGVTVSPAVEVMPALPAMLKHQDLRWLVPKEVRMKSSTYEVTLEEGRQEGLKRGFQQGLEQGLQEGRERGLERGIEQGRELERQATVTMLRRICLRFMRYKDAFEEHDEELIEVIDDPKRLEALAHSLIWAVSADAARTKFLEAVGRRTSR